MPSVTGKLNLKTKAILIAKEKGVAKETDGECLRDLPFMQPSFCEYPISTLEIVSSQ